MSNSSFGMRAVLSFPDTVQDGVESGYRQIFQCARVSLWDQDFSDLVARLRALRRAGIADIRRFFEDDPAELVAAMGLVKIRDMNAYTLELFGAKDREELLAGLPSLFTTDAQSAFLDQVCALWNGQRRIEAECKMRSLGGRLFDVLLTISWVNDGERAIVSIADISRQKASEQRLQKLNQISRLLNTEHDIQRLVQTVTDLATELTGADFGAFFHNEENESGESYLLYTLSGAPRSAFEKFGLPRNTAVFNPTFTGESTVRSADIRIDPRYGKSAPHHGMPKGHLPVVSYLAVPVVSRAGHVHGGLFFGHKEAEKFTAEHEELIKGLAAHAAIALDNATLIKASQKELAQRKLAEEAALKLAGDLQKSEARERARYDQVTAVMEAVPAVIWFARDSEAKDIHGNRAANDLLKVAPNTNSSLSAPEEVRPRHFEVFADGKRVAPDDLPVQRAARGEDVRDFEEEIRFSDGTSRFLLGNATPLKGPDGKVAAAVAAFVDITDRKAAEAQRELLLEELNHRVKNTLATVISIAQQSFAKDSSSADARAAFEGRLRALAQTHSRLADVHWSGVSLDDLVGDVLRPYTTKDPRRIELNGPPVSLSSKAAVSLGMAFHELATNAAKYGALTRAEGRLSVVWAIEDESVLRIQWRELDGPPVVPPTRKGFGSLLLERGMADFKGKVAVSYLESGVVWSMTFPLRQLLGT